MSPGDSTVLFRAPSTSNLSASERRAIREFANYLTRELAPQSTFTCLISSDNELQSLNKEFLSHDYPTDVLSFPSLPGSADLGEMAISVEHAAIQASAFGHGILDEIRILMLHGFLHLTGLNHETDGGEMASVEERWRLHFALPNSLIERSHVERRATGHEVFQ